MPLYQVSDQMSVNDFKGELCDGVSLRLEMFTT